MALLAYPLSRESRVENVKDNRPRNTINLVYQSRLLALFLRMNICNNIKRHLDIINS